MKAHGIANPQWTPLRHHAPAWMELGFRLFDTLEDSEPALEVFPSSSAVLAGDRSVSATIDFAAFAPGPKDLLDACIAAVTVREFTAGRGMSVGGGDGLGTIVLPRAIRRDVIQEVLDWPDAR